MARKPITAAQTMPLVDEWIKARTLPQGKETSTTLWRDWARFVGDPDIQGLALGYRPRSLHIALKARGYEFHHSGFRYVLRISLRPAGELAPSALAGEGAPVVRGAQDVL